MTADSVTEVLVGIAPDMLILVLLGGYLVLYVGELAKMARSVGRFFCVEKRKRGVVPSVCSLTSWRSYGHPFILRPSHHLRSSA